MFRATPGSHWSQDARATTGSFTCYPMIIQLVFRQVQQPEPRLDLGKTTGSDTQTHRDTWFFSSTQATNLTRQGLWLASVALCLKGMQTCAARFRVWACRTSLACEEHARQLLCTNPLQRNGLQVDGGVSCLPFVGCGGPSRQPQPSSKEALRNIRWPWWCSTA